MPEGRAQFSNELLIFPANGNGLEALDCLGSAFRCLGFVDDTPEKQLAGAWGYPVLSRAALAEHPKAKVLAVPGGPQSYKARARIIGSLGIAAERFATVIHPTARVSPLATIGHGVLIMAGVVITSNAVIGNHVCILPNTVIHHDSSIGDWSLLGSNVTLASSSRIGTNCYIGSGTSIMNGVEIGDRALVGIGSNVIRNIRADARAVGNPTRELGEEQVSN
jgi:sugar O-acyltransferase (sialic acid O-acetyltransferase NeuD family)